MAEHSLRSSSNESVMPLTDLRGCRADLNGSCCQQLLSVARVINSHLWYEYKKSEQNLAGADIYTTVILGVFASIITLLMVRSIKSKESLDEQVVTLLSSMQMRIEHDETLRHRKSMREAKRKAQILLADLKSKSLARVVSRRAKSASFFSSSSRSREASVCSVPEGSAARDRMPLRTRSYNGVLPSIVVHDEVVVSHSPPTSPPGSRQSSVFSDGQSVYSVDHDTMFRFPEQTADVV